MTTTHQMSPPEQLADPDVAVLPAAELDEAARTWPTPAMDQWWPRFRTAASRHGYDEGRAATMYAALPSLHLDADVAARWMEVGFTSWGTRVWLEAGFDPGSPDEAAEYQRWMYTAEEAFWARKDGTSRADLEARRALLELLSHQG